MNEMYFALKFRDMNKISQAVNIPEGVWPVMLTPFASGETIDFAALDRLIDWYIDQGVQGLFSACLSSEALQMSDENKRALIRHVLDRVDGRVPVVAGVMGYSSRGKRVDAAAEVIEAGAEAAVFTLCDIVPKVASDEEWIEEMDAHLALLGDIPLGVYECPWPYHRILTPALTAYVAQRPQFLFLKETSGNLSEMIRKKASCAGTGLKVFSADALSIYEALRMGIDGFSGLQTNLWPGLHVRLFQSWRQDPHLAEQLQKFFIDYDWVLKRGYPASAKRYLKTAYGLEMRSLSHLNGASLSANDQEWIEKLAQDVSDFTRNAGCAEAQGAA